MVWLGRNFYGVGGDFYFCNRRQVLAVRYKKQYTCTGLHVHHFISFAVVYSYMFD